MKRLMIALLSTSAIAFAVPAAAHPEDHATTAEAPWNNGGATYADFNREYQQVWDGVQHGLSDHSYTREQGDRFLATMREIRARADEMQREGRYDPQLTHVRLAQLHNEMDAAHERGHDRLDHAGQVTTYAQFSREYRHVWDTIHHGMSDGSYTRTEGLQFARTLRRRLSRRFSFVMVFPTKSRTLG